MLQEKGIVKEVLGERAEVLVRRKESCEGCASAKMCRPSGEEMLVLASNSAKAVVGNKVILSVSSRKFLTASAIIYILPILGLLVGMLVGHFIYSNRFSSDEMSFFFGVSGLAVTISGLWLYNRREESSSSIIPVITKIL